MGLQRKLKCARAASRGEAPIHLKPLADKATRSVFIIEYLLLGGAKIAGPNYHNWIANWLGLGVYEEDQLLRFVQQLCPTGNRCGKRFAEALRWAEQRVEAGWWVATWQDQNRFPKECPKVLFGRGRLDSDVRWLAVLNSRKPKLTSPDAQWLAALRQALADHAPGAATGIASSFGTTTYDLLTALARQGDRPLCLILPFPLEQLTTNEALASLLTGKKPDLALTCQSAILRCSRAARQFCRDQLLVHLADDNLALEIRTGGNLHTILQERQTNRPGGLIVFRPTARDPGNAGNFSLMESFPTAETFELKKPPKAPPTGEGAAAPGLFCQWLPTREYWDRYLYHYTRACPGPWPGQSYREYLLALWENEPLCEHTALETLVRMLREKRVRASNRITRGAQPVISWSARPPSEIAAMRRWNPALIRWTFEPYGIAISKKVLLTIGAKPAIYAAEEFYSRLDGKDRFRYQRHAPPACAWKQEREWRSPGDLALDERCRRHGFIFVNTHADAEYVARSAEMDMPIMVLSALRSTPGPLP